MQNKKVILVIALLSIFSVNLNAQYANTDTSYKRCFVGSTLFMFGNFATVNSPNFVQLNLGYRLTNKDVISLEFITWKYAWPLGLNPFYHKEYGKDEEQFPGYVREFGLGLAYQRYFWKGLYAAAHATPMLQKFVDDKGNKAGNGFHLFSTFRIGYHIKLFKDKFFIEPSVGIAGRPIRTKMPNGFYQIDDRWPKYTPEPGLHVGFNF